MDASIAHRTWRTLEPYHAAIYFVPEAPEEYATLGLDDRWSGYFASRSAPLGPVPAPVVAATFFNFEPGFVGRSLDGVWERTSPVAVSAARLRAADRMIRRYTGDGVAAPWVRDAAELAQVAALAACDLQEGRPLFAAHAAMDWPDEPHLVLWHAQTLLREFRGDGHIAVLTSEGLSGCEALVTHAATGVVSAEGLRTTRHRSPGEWAGATESLRRRGWLAADGELTERGRTDRERIERRTDELAAAPYEALGEEWCARLRELVRPASRSMSAAFA